MARISNGGGSNSGGQTSGTVAGVEGMATQVETAQTNYIASLRSMHEAMRAEITTAEQTIATNETLLTNRQQSMAALETQLRNLGEDIGTTAAPRRGRGRPPGSRNRATPTGTGRRGVRSGNDGSVTDAIEQFMGRSRRGTNFDIASIEAGVLASGYKSNSSNFTIIINQALARLVSDGRVRRVSRGVYAQARGAAAPARTRAKRAAGRPRKSARRGPGRPRKTAGTATPAAAPQA